MKVIVIDSNSPSIDFSALHSAGIDGVYLRASHGTVVDKSFEENYDEAKEAGLKVGAYHLYEAPRKEPYTIASCKEGRTFGSAIKGKKLDLPVAMLMDDYRRALERREIYNGINAFAQNIDKKSRMAPVWKTNKLFVAGSYLQLKTVAEDNDLSVYPKWCLGDRLYMDAKVLPVDDYEDFVVYEIK